MLVAGIHKREPKTLLRNTALKATPGGHCPDYHSQEHILLYRYSKTNTNEDFVLQATVSTLTAFGGFYKNNSDNSRVYPQLAKLRLDDDLLGDWVEEESDMTQRSSFTVGMVPLSWLD